MDRSGYVKIKINDILTEFIDECNLQAVTHNRLVYFEIVRGCYGLPNSGKLANDSLCTRLNKGGYSEAATTLELYKHTWLPIQISLSLIILELNMWKENMPTTSAKSSKNIMKYQKIVKEKNYRHWPGM